MTHRGVLTTIGAAALGAGLLLGGAATIPPALAQSTSPAATAPSTSTGQTPADSATSADAQRTRAYDDFVASLAKSLGVDATKVDAAIRTTLKQQIDDRLAAGDIDKVQAAAMKSAIDASDAPLAPGFGGPGGMRGFGGGDHDAGRGPRGGDSSLPPAQPGNDAPASQNGAQTAPADAPTV